MNYLCPGCNNIPRWEYEPETHEKVQVDCPMCLGDPHGMFSAEQWLRPGEIDQREEEMKKEIRTGVILA